MGRTPWYRWFPSDFGGSIKVKAMSDLAELVYRRLLDALWESKDCLLPEDLPFLHNVLLPRRPFSEFEAVWSELTRPGFEVITRPAEGMISNRRILLELEDTRAMIEQKKAAGRRSAELRAERAAKAAAEGSVDPTGVGTGVGTGVTTGVGTGGSTGSQREGNHPHPHPHPHKEKERGTSVPPKKVGRFTPPSGLELKESHPWLNAQAWDDWVKFRKELGKPIKTKVGVSQQVNFLKKHQEDHVDILAQSMKNEWQGLFELKTNGNNHKTKAQALHDSNAKACMEALCDD
jgi:hypothetical protein